jgi:Cysteine-rich secretory protein family
MLRINAHTARCRTISLIVAAAFLLPCWAVHAEDPGICISTDEAELLTLVNEYRVENALAPVTWSRSLITVGQWHVWDAVNNAPFGGDCNLHSWSGNRPDLWVGLCYTPDHAQAALMWSKPSEITSGIYSSSGYENGAAGYLSVADALEGWKNSPGHNDVILNQGIWSGLTWRAMGVGADTVNSYYYLWFGSMTDPQAAMPLCGGDLIFSDGFEGGTSSQWSATVP